jgi:hypothetical protein
MTERSEGIMSIAGLSTKSTFIGVTPKAPVR